jgi:hypothetical protein
MSRAAAQAGPEAAREAVPAARERAVADRAPVLRPEVEVRVPAVAKAEAGVPAGLQVAGGARDPAAAGVPVAAQAAADRAQGARAPEAEAPGRPNRFTTRPATPRTTCCAPSTSATPTPTC